jgi:DNA ligase-4
LDGETEAEEETQIITSEPADVGEEISHTPVDAGSEHSDWFKAGDVKIPETNSDQEPDESHTESDADSYNEDVRSQDGDDDELLQVKDEEGNAEDQSVSTDHTTRRYHNHVAVQVQEPTSHPRMGETEDAMNYDQDRIFTHLSNVPSPPASNYSLVHADAFILIRHRRLENTE